MTGVEMAEQFADNIDSIELNRRLLSARNKNHTYRLGRHDGFLAGFEAGRPKWHDLRKNPEDLPPLERGSYTVNVLTNNGDIAFYDYDDGCWILDPVDCEIDPPIAWCEIPKFEEADNA